MAGRIFEERRNYEEGGAHMDISSVLRLAALLTTTCVIYTFYFVQKSFKSHEEKEVKKRQILTWFYFYDIFIFLHSMYTFF